MRSPQKVIISDKKREGNKGHTIFSNFPEGKNGNNKTGLEILK